MSFKSLIYYKIILLTLLEETTSLLENYILLLVTQNFQNICCKIFCLPTSPRIFEHLQNGIITHF